MSDLAAIASQLGYFLDYRLWESAIQLLDYQLSLKPKNKHYNTLSMFYYENLPQSDKVRVHVKEYFDKKVANNLLYGLEREFAIHSYPIPKASLGLRKYRFLTYPMRIAYYSLGLYLLQLSQEFTRQYYSSHKHIHSYYGGALSIDEKSRALQLRYESVWYKPHYQEFRKRVRRAVEGDTKNMIVIHMDIQNYFEEIAIPTLMGFLSDYIKPSIQKELRFDPITKGQITIPSPNDGPQAAPFTATSCECSGHWEHLWQGDGLTMRSAFCEANFDHRGRSIQPSERTPLTQK